MELLLAHLAEITLAVFAAILARVLPLIRRRVDDWLARQRLDSALGRAAGLILASPDVQIRGAAALDAQLDIGRAYLRSAIPDTLRALDVSDDRLRLMLRGEAGKHLRAIR